MSNQNIIYHEDCNNTIEKLPLIDCIVTSPPYNIGLKYDTYNDNTEETLYCDWLCNIFFNLYDKLQDEGHIFVNIDGTNLKPYLPFAFVNKMSEKYVLQNTITWIKSISINDITYGHFKPINSNRFLNHTHEYIFHFTKKGNSSIDRKSIGVPYMDKSNIKRRNHSSDLRCNGDTWFIPYKTVNSKTQKFNHPGSFPIEIPEKCIKLTGIKNGNVYDPFMGTGTTFLAANNCDWNGYGSEISDNYVDVIKARLENESIPFHISTNTVTKEEK